jgi:uncharacterized protein with FMN-binding domain
MRRVVLAILSTVAALVMLLSFKTHASTSSASPPAAVSGTSAGSSSPDSSSETSTPSRKTSQSTTRTVTGTAAETAYGPVQVKVSVKSGKVTAVTATEYPSSDPRDAQINSYAIPALDKETLAAGSASIDMISGATYTSNGYITSLQSALDKAGA